MQWQDTIKSVVDAVVSIYASEPLAFDTEDPGCTEATGFVVDVENGCVFLPNPAARLLLTRRQVHSDESIRR
jgi:hypothetical protein